MATKFNLKIVTPDGKKLEDEAIILNCVTTAGAVGILAHHLPLVAVLDISHLNYKTENDSVDISITGGILNVKEDGVLILAEAFEKKSDIDIVRAEAAKERALALIHSNDPNVDIKRAETALKRAMSRLSL